MQIFDWTIQAGAIVAGLASVALTLSAMLTF